MGSLETRAETLQKIILDAGEVRPEFVLQINVGKFKVKSVIVGLGSLEFDPLQPDEAKVEFILTNLKGAE